VELVGEPAYLRELRNKLAPVAFGADFRLMPEGDEPTIVVTVSWNCYYRIFPTIAQQREHQKQQTATVKADEATTEEVATEAKASPLATSDTSNAVPSQPAGVEDGDDNTLAVEQEKEEAQVEQESPEATETARDRRRARISKDSLFVRFRKIPCHAIGRVMLRLEPNGEWNRDLSELQAALDAETERSQDLALADPDRVRTDGDPTAHISVPETALASEEDYATFLHSLKTPVVPEWKWEAKLDVRPSQTDDPNERVLQFAFVNVSPQQSPPRMDGSTRQRDNPNIEPFLFDTSASFEFAGGRVEPFELELAPRSFRYNRDLWGRGFNCAVEHDEQTNVFSTSHTPTFRQMRYTTQEIPEARFDDLARDPLPTLETIASAMESYLSNWEVERGRYVSTVPNWDALFGGSFEHDKAQFEAEIANFRRGLELIRHNPEVRIAFQLTNETFRRSGTQNLPPNKHKNSWRLFQLVFLVIQIPGIVALSAPQSSDAGEREVVDIIYFPTGGGKTEAYLATLIFHCFFDRLRGKSAGVTAWTRFPLRLLTLQQTQRVADVIGIADLVRREQPDERLNGKKVAGLRIPVKVAGDSGDGDHCFFKSALLVLFYASFPACVNI